MTRVKQVILIRKDLTMRRGKEIAQGSHASMEFLVSQIRGVIPVIPGHTHGSELSDNSDPCVCPGITGIHLSLTAAEVEWIKAGTAKVCLKVESEEQLLDCHQRAKAAGLKSYVITDSGRTEFRGMPTRTACAIGPDLASEIDKITGELVPY